MLIKNNGQFNAAFAVTRFLRDIKLIKEDIVDRFHYELDSKYSNEFELCDGCNVVGLDYCVCGENNCGCDYYLGIPEVEDED